MIMMYLSKGLVQEKSTGNSLNLARGGREYLLTGIEAAVWLRGWFSFENTKSEIEEKTVSQLHQKGLVEMEEKSEPLQKYRILTRCVCCPIKRVGRMSAGLGVNERKIDTWLRKTGICLSVAELVYLMEHEIPAAPEYLHAKNRQNLVELIYCENNIQDNLLEQQMEQARCRDEVVSGILELVRKKRIIIL